LQKIVGRTWRATEERIAWDRATDDATVEQLVVKFSARPVAWHLFIDAETE